MSASTEIGVPCESEPLTIPAPKHVARAELVLARPSSEPLGLVGLARGLASEFAAQNIRVNVVSPGSIDTTRTNPEWYQGHVPSAAGIPLGRQGRVDEIAATCLFLVSDDGGFITGQTIHVNGGTAFH